MIGNNRLWCGAALAVAGAAAATVAVIGATAGGGDQLAALGASASWTTVYKSPLAIEGLTGDADGNLYIAQRGGSGNPCPILRLTPASSGTTTALVGTVPTPCSPSGLTFDAAGNLYVTGVGTAQDTIDVLTPNASAPPTGVPFTGGVPGANGIAFDRQGHLWATDGSTSQGRVWRVLPDANGNEAAHEMFRVPPMKQPNLIGRQVETLSPSAQTQTIAANGIEFSKDGSSVFVADTARGAVWKVGLDGDGNIEDRVGCDAAYTDDTLCPDSLYTENPQLEGADGLVLDESGNVWVAANERNALVVVEPNGRVVEFFRNPIDATTGLRNAGPLETPTSPMFLGHTLCVTQSDGNRRDNSPNSAGEAAPGTSVLGKVSCLDQRLPIPGAPLPIG